MKDAVLVPCCGKSFCKECTYNVLLLLLLSLSLYMHIILVLFFSGFSFIWQIYIIRKRKTKWMDRIFFLRWLRTIASIYFLYPYDMVTAKQHQLVSHFFNGQVESNSSLNMWFEFNVDIYITYMCTQHHIHTHTLLRKKGREEGIGGEGVLICFWR